MVFQYSAWPFVTNFSQKPPLFFSQWFFLIFCVRLFGPNDRVHLEKNIATVFKTRLSLKGKTEGPLTRRRRENAAEVCKLILLQD